MEQLLYLTLGGSALALLLMLLRLLLKTRLSSRHRKMHTTDTGAITSKTAKREKKREG